MSKVIWKPQPRQQRALSCPADIIFYGGAAGGGKLLDLNTPILTTHGWKTMGSVEVGDYVFNEEGKQTKVIWKSEISRERTFRITFDGHAKIIAGENHEWVTLTDKERSINFKRTPEYRDKRRNIRPSRSKGKKDWLAELNSGRNYEYLTPIEPQKRTTLELYNTQKDHRGRINHTIRTADPVQFQSQELLIHPYVLGSWLGDGCHYSGGYTTLDVWMIDKFRQLGYEVTDREDPKEWYIKGIISQIKQLGLYKNKHIPDVYKYSSVDQRLDLIRGILDSDGYVHSSGKIEISLSHEPLAKDVAEVIRSLGIKLNVRQRESKLYGVKKKDRYRMMFTTDLDVFSLPRHVERHKVSLEQSSKERRNNWYITEIVEIEQVDTQCIQVDCHSHLYLAGEHLIPTHNSDWLLADFCKQLKFGPDHRGIIFRRSMPELEQLITRAHEIYGKMGASWSEQKKKYTFQTGSEIKFRFLDSDLDVHKYQGHEYTWIGWDELTNWPSDYSFIYMISRARSAKGVPTWIRAAGNPGGPGQAWVKHMFIDSKLPEKLYTIIDVPVEMPDGSFIQIKKTSTFIPAKLTDNYELMKKDPGYKANLMMQPEHIRRALLDGDWNVFSGQIFEEFKYDKHVVKPFALDRNWIRWTAMDWGYSKPFSIQWFAITGDGRVIMYREWYGCEEGKANVGIKMSASEVAQKAMELSYGDGCNRMVADPACWGKTGASAKDGSLVPSIAETFEQAGWRMDKANNDRMNGLARMHDLLSTVGQDGLPMMLVFNTCHHFIRTLPALTADPRRPEDVNTAAEDHSYDSCRYMVMHLETMSRELEYGTSYEEITDRNDSGEYDVLNHGF